jgi:phage-related protein
MENKIYLAAFLTRYVVLRIFNISILLHHHSFYAKTHLTLAKGALRYTFLCILGKHLVLYLMSHESERPKLAEIVWEGDSLDVLRTFPEAVMQNFGFELWQLQQGERPRNYRPLSSVGSGVFELRDQDESGWYRIVYLSRIDDVIYVLHCFEKKSRQMPGKDFQRSKQRFRAVKARLAMEKKREKQS